MPPRPRTVGFLVVTVLPAGDVKDTASALVDPVLVIVVSLMVLPAPVGFVRTMLRELLEMKPPPEIEHPARQAVTERLRHLSVATWINVELSCDPAWQQG